MPTNACYRLLCCSVGLIALVGALRALGLPALHYGAAAVVSAAIIGAAWAIGAREARTGPEERRRLATAGAMLLAVWAVLPFIAAAGPPHIATAGENTARYVALLLCTFVLSGGLFVLRDALHAAGERHFSTLGLAAIAAACPLYAFFAAVQLCGVRAAARGATPRESPWLASLDDVALVMLFFGALLTYLAAAAFAWALGRRRWIGPGAARAYAAFGLIAPALAGVRIVEALASPSGALWGWGAWYAFPGFVLMIPAVPWVALCLLGIAVLRRAGTGSTA